MAKILYNGKQYTLTVSPDLIKRMGWKKGTEVIISKDMHSDMLFIEEIKDEK